MTKQWGAVLRGRDYDLEDWREMLKPPFDPWVEVDRDDVVLRSKSLDDLTSASEVRDRVVAHIDRLNGVMFVVRRSRPLQFSGVVEFAPDGKVHRTVFLVGRMEEARDRMHAAGIVVTGPDGKPQPPPPAKASEVQHWAAIADNDDLLEDALIYFGRVSAPELPHPPTFWFDIYKALECLMHRSGGETEFLALNWAPPNDVRRLKRTADWARHARRKKIKPSPATTEQEAIDLMSRLLRKAFETAGAP